MNITNGGSFNKKIAFSGQKKIVDDYGFEKQKFFLPYDQDKYAATVELYKVEKKNGKYLISSKMCVDPISLDKDGNAEVDIDKIFTNQNQFAYRFKLTDKKDSSKVKYVFDPGTVTNIKDDNTNNKFNIVFNNRAVINKAGKMQLIMLDQYYPGLEKDADGNIKLNSTLRAKALSSVRTHANKLGGGLLGVIYKLSELEKEGYTRIVGMPITKDTVSSHLYWTQNAFQLSPQLGSMDDFKKMQTEMFKHGINWVSDAALVNEGLEGVHFSSVLKWGKESPFYNWFKATGLETGPLTLGILPENTEHVKYKLINSPFKLDDKLSVNNDYDLSKPTYVQFYDDRLASKSQKTDNNIIETYAYNNPNLNPDNKSDTTYDITTHNDTVSPYAFEINPKILDKNIKQRKAETNGKKLDLQSYDTIKDIMKFENFNIDKKVYASGVENWDGNTDIAKLNFYLGKLDVEALKGSPIEKKNAHEAAEQGVLQVKDYAINSGKYWTKLSADIQLAYVADLLKDTFPSSEDYMDKIKTEVKAGRLPKSLLDEEIINANIIDNIFDKKYNLPRLQINVPPKELILKESLDYPLETLPASQDLLAVLTSPYITKRATKPSQLGLSKIELYKAGNDEIPVKYRKTQEKVDYVYSQELSKFSMDILNGLGLNLFKDGKVTDLGKYVISEVMPEITKYAMVKSLDSSTKVVFTKDGNIDYSHISPDSLSLSSLGIKGKSPEDEANAVINKMAKGIGNISQENKSALTTALKTKLKGANVDSYKVAEAIIDRTESGMGWRIDAAKDVASIDAVRHGKDSFEMAWDNVIDFWKVFNQTVRKVNPHVYTTAEITDLGDLTRVKNPSNGRFESDVDAETKFIEETGITTTANYSYFYSLIPQMYAKGFEKGNVEDVYDGKDKNPENNGQNKMWPLQQKLDGVYSGWKASPGFLFQSPLDGVLHSYTFIGNHDKPRLLHMLALNPELFFSKFSEAKDSGRSEEEKHRNIAAVVLQKDKRNIDFDKTSGEAIAMGQRLRQAFEDAATGPNPIIDQKTLSVINKSIASMAGGEFKGKKFESKAFGERPFEIVISNVLEDAQYQGLELSNDKKQKIEKEVFKTIVTPAMDRYYTIYKTLVTLPGDVTDFAGDKLASTGSESKAKNYAQQNRNTIRWEWIDKNNSDYRDYVKKFYDNMNNILALRNKPELSALNDGIPVSLPKQDEAEKFYALLRYNDKKSTVLTLYNSSGASLDNTKPMNRQTEEISQIKLDQKDKPRQGLVGGLSEGMVFKNAREEDKTDYRVVYTQNDGYVIKRFDANGKNINIQITPDDCNALVLNIPKTINVKTSQSQTSNASDNKPQQINQYQTHNKHKNKNNRK